MIGSHNTMTYLKAESKVWESISGYWRCQDKTLDEQIEAGVRWFDIRIVYDNSAQTERSVYYWKFAHGEVDLAMNYKTNNSTGRGAGNVRLTFDTVMDKIQACGGVARIMLERGDIADEELFSTYFAPNSVACKKWPCIIGAIIKKDWKVLWNSRNDLGLIDCSYVPYKRDTSVWKQLKSILKFPFNTIKKRAEKGSQPTKSQIKNEKWVWIYDYVYKP